MKVIRYEKDTVLIQEGSIKAWVDVVINNGKLYIDWNKMIYLQNKKEDMILKKWQDKAENFDNATDLAVETLEKLGIIYKDDNDKWHQTEKYFTTKGSIDIL